MLIPNHTKQEFHAVRETVAEKNILNCAEINEKKHAILTLSSAPRLTHLDAVLCVFAKPIFSFGPVHCPCF